MGSSLNRYFGAIILVLLVGGQAALGAIAVDVIKDINNGDGSFGQVNVFTQGAPWGIDQTAVYKGNNVLVYTMDGFSASNGAGLSVSVSNGENGITSSQGGANPDVNNATPAHSVFTTIGNAGGRLLNGNAIRFSLWMRQDPASPVMAEPQVESVVKMELWKEAMSGNTDYAGAPFSSFGDRLWDDDQNATFHPAQTQASWVDINNNGTIFGGQAVAVSLVPNEWRLIQHTMIIDDNPDGSSGGWLIGGEPFQVSAVEEIRSVFFIGDYAGTDLTAGGSIWLDNLMVEVFANEAAMLATPSPNPNPSLDEVDGNADFDGSGTIDGNDALFFQRGLGIATGATRAQGDANGDGAVTAADLDIFVAQFGQPAPLGVAAIGVVPEPVGATLALMAAAALGARRRRTG